jgi:PleD family two-component response regulator
LPVHRRTCTEIEEKKEEFAVVDELTNLNNIKEFTNLMRHDQMKDFYLKAN